MGKWDKGMMKNSIQKRKMIRIIDLLLIICMVVYFNPIKV